MMKFTRFFAIFMAIGVVSLVGATSSAQETPAPTGGTGEATGTADAAAEMFGKKENVSIKHTQNYKSCFKFKDQTIGGGMYIDCFPYQPYIGGGPFVIFKMEYTEPVLVVEAVTEPGTSGIDDVPGQSGVETLMGGMSASGRSTAYGGAERPAMPTAAHQPQAYFDAHVWGLGPMGRFAATKRSGMDIPPAKKMEAAQSLACDIADSYIGYWPMAIKRDILLKILSMAPQLTVAYLFDWGFSWFSGLGGLMDLAGGFSSMGDMGSAMGGLGNMGGALGGAMGGMGGAMGSLTGAMGGMGGMMSGGMGGLMGGAMGSLGSMGSAFGGAMSGLGSLTGSVGGFMGGFGNVMGGVQNIMSVGQGGPGGMAANMMSNFVGDSGNQSMFMVAGAAVALGYAMNSDDKEYVCKTKQQIDRGVEGTNNMVQQTSSAQSQQLMQPAAFLPPGYPTQKTYDTCHLTGDGYYMDPDGTPHFANCHPEEKAMLLNCSRRTASLLDKEEVSRYVNVAYAQIPLADHTVDSCTAGKGIQFTDDGDTFRVVRVSRCDNRLSNMQQNGYFIACDDNSKTYSSCGRTFTGEAKYDPMRGSELESALANAGLETSSKGLEGQFAVCAFPEGTKTVDQLKDYNAGLQEFAETAATFAATGMTEAQKEINRKAEEMDAQCENGRSKNNSGGSALGNVGTAVAGAVVAQTAMSFLGKVGGSLSGAMGGAGGGMMSMFGSGTSHMMGNMLSQVPGASAVTGITDQMSGAMSGAMGGVTNALGGIAGVGNAAGALSNLNSSVSTYMNAYNMLAGGGLGQIANNLDDVFKITNEVFPVFLSEANESDWRDDRKASRQMSLNPLGMMGAGLKAMGCEIAGMASGVTDMVGMGRVFDKSLQDVCLAWGPVQPLTGFIPTSGNDFPAAGLAKWRGYQRAKVFLAKKKMEQDMWKFNLDYPHYSRCFEIGAPSTRWESRGLALKEEMMPGIAGDIINSATDMFSNFTGAGGITDFTKMAEGLQGGLKVEEGKFISTYWKKTECITTACAIDGQVLHFKQQK